MTHQKWCIVQHFREEISMLTVIKLDDIEDAKSKVNELIEKGAYMDALYALYTLEENDRFEELLKLMDADDLLNIRQDKVFAEYKPVINSVLPQKGIGEIIEFGTYQNETIRWRVIDKSGDKKLLISEQPIDCKSYHSEKQYITWEECDLRKWLNEEFIKEAFSEEEQKHINKTRISNKDNERYKTKGGNDTEDKLFLLSIEEAYKYFADDNDRICKATDYAKKRGAWTSSSGSCWWWLRSPGSISLNAAGVSHGGDVCESGCYVRGDDRAVRPAFWLNP